MANTYTQIYLQIVIVVKYRQYLIPSAKKDHLYKYMTGIIQKRGHKLLTINGIPDHVHILIGFNPDKNLTDAIKEVKRCSTNFMNNQKWFKGKFLWQRGYGCFSYSRSHLNMIIKYIEDQEKHHQKRSFKEEYIELLKRYEVDFDDRYLFDDLQPDL